MIADSVGFVVDHGREAVYDAEHFFDGYRADRDYALATLRAARQAGCADARPVRHERRHAHRRARPDRRRRPRHARGATPMRRAVTWGIHTHNDAELAVANSIAAVQAGVRHVQATINGYGERCGNANMVSHPRQPRAQDAQHAVARGRRRPRGPDRAQPRRWPRSRTRCPTTTSRTSGARRSRTRAASTARPWPRSSAATSTWTRARSATPAGSSSPSSAARPTPRSGRASSATSSRASSTRASCPRSSSGSRTKAWPSRARRRRSSC